MAMPLIPALDSPITNAAKKARTQEEKEISDANSIGTNEVCWTGLKSMLKNNTFIG